MNKISEKDFKLLLGEEEIKVNIGDKEVYKPEKPDPLKIPLCVTALEADSSVELCFEVYGGEIDLHVENVQYSRDKVNWISFNPVNIETPGVNTIILSNVGDKVYFRSDITGDCDITYLRFYMTGLLAVSGNVNSLYAHEDFESIDTLEYTYCYQCLFQECPITTSPRLPATNLSEGCYYYMFGSCTSLIETPELPATTLAENCYYVMFYGCTSLTTAPALPAIILDTGCYKQMFKGCTSLISVPSLPATTLVNYCYLNMFFGCTSLKFSETQSEEYPNAYRIPRTGTGTDALSALWNIFSNTGGTFTSDPTINTTYYTSNEVI